MRTRSDPAEDEEGPAEVESNLLEVNTTAPEHEVNTTAGIHTPENAMIANRLRLS